MIVIPMAGLSRRFAEVGYTEPKYRLPLGDSTVFAHAVGSFAAYRDRLPFLFIVCVQDEAEGFIRSQCGALGITDARIVSLDGATAGQAETVERGLLGVDASEDEPVTIFNIDTFRPGYSFPSAAWADTSDGFLDVFRGSGANWSYVRPPTAGGQPLVLETTEKRPISDLCCTGLYHFARTADFRFALAAERAEPTAPELYVAPLYNHLIEAGRRIHYDLVAAEAVTFCGVPAEYEALVARLDAGGSRK